MGWKIVNNITYSPIVLHITLSLFLFTPKSFLSIHFNTCNVSVYAFFVYTPHLPLTPLQYSCLENPMDGGAW